MHGDGKPPAVDEMKCYMMGPHRVGVARAAYWPFGPSLARVRVTQLASGRNHMACIGVPRSDAGDAPAPAEVAAQRHPDAPPDALTEAPAPAPTAPLPAPLAAGLTCV